MTLSNTCSTRVDGWWIVIATVRFRLHTDDRVSAIVNAVVESVGGVIESREGIFRTASTKSGAVIQVRRVRTTTVLLVILMTSFRERLGKVYNELTGIEAKKRSSNLRDCASTKTMIDYQRATLTETGSGLVEEDDAGLLNSVDPD